MQDTPSPRSQAVGAALVAVASVAFGTLGVLNRQLHEAGIPVPQMLAVRFAVGAVVLWALVFARREKPALPPPRLALYGVMAVLYVAESWFYFESSQRIPVALTVLLLYAYPALVTIGAWALWRQHPGARGLAALALASLGILLAVGRAPSALDGAGVAFGLGTAVVYGGYVLMASRVQQGVSALVGSAWLMSFAALIFVAAAAVHGPLALDGAARAWPSLLGLVAFGTVPIPLLLVGVTRIGATRAAIISTVEPVAGAACGALFLGEVLSGLQLVGGALVVAAVLATASKPLK